MRKNTELETQLLEHGWKLVSKTYKGNRSERTGAYCYEKKLDIQVEEEQSSFDAAVYLSSNRKRILDWKIKLEEPVISRNTWLRICEANRILKAELTEIRMPELKVENHD